MSAAPIDVFLSYSHKDEEFKRELEKHVTPLVRAGLVTIWHDRRISPGTNWKKDIDCEISPAADTPGRRRL